MEKIKHTKWTLQTHKHRDRMEKWKKKRNYRVVVPSSLKSYILLLQWKKYYGLEKHKKIEQIEMNGQIEMKWKNA